MRTRTSIEIECPADVVFEYVADMENNPAWQGGMTSCAWTSAGPVAVGSTYDQEASFLGRRITSSFEVVEFDRPSFVRIVSTVSTFPLDVSRRVEAIGQARSRVTAVVAGDPEGLFRLAAPLLEPMVARSIAKDYNKLKALLET